MQQGKTVSSELHALFPDKNNKFAGKNEAEHKEFLELKKTIKNIYDEIKKLTEVIGEKSEN